MKKTLTLLMILSVVIPSYLCAQVDGNYESNYRAAKANYNYNTPAPAAANYQYTNTQTLTNSNRQPATTPYVQNTNEVNVQINGLINVVADNYVAVFSLDQVGESIDSTNRLMNARIQRFTQQLKNIGIDEADIKEDMISFVPKYEVQPENRVFSKNYTEVPAGFELQKNISVRFKNSAKISDLISAAANVEIYDIVKVDYFVSNFQSHLDSLKNKCLQALKAKTHSYEVIGFKLDTLKKVMSDDFTTVYPQTRYFSYQAFTRNSLTIAKKKNNKDQPIVNEASKVTSRFYEQIDYDRYDLVVNPIVTEPVVQISYSILVKYFMNNDKQNNIYYILTPSGEIKQFVPK